MTSAPAIGFEYRPSRLLRRLLIVVASLTMLAIVLCALATWMKLLLMAGVLMATGQSLRRVVNSPVAAAGWSAGHDWVLHLADREDVPATLASFRVLGVFVLLRLQTVEQGMQVLLLAPDNSDADIRRRLRMRLAAVQLGEAVPRL
ncbi:protein YgfX [Rhodanobacter koreensis]